MWKYQFSYRHQPWEAGNYRLCILTKLGREIQAYCEAALCALLKNTQTLINLIRILSYYRQLLWYSVDTCISHLSEWQWQRDTELVNTTILPPILISFHPFDPLLASFSWLSVSFSPCVAEHARSLHHLFPLCFHLCPPSVAPANNELEAAREKQQIKR